MMSMNREWRGRRSARALELVEQIAADLFALEDGLPPWDEPEPLSEDHRKQRRSFDDTRERIRENVRILRVYWGTDDSVLAEADGVASYVAEASDAVRRSFSGQSDISKAERRRIRGDYQDRRERWVEAALRRAERPPRRRSLRGRTSRFSREAIRVRFIRVRHRLLRLPKKRV